MTLDEHNAKLKAEGKWDDFVARRREKECQIAERAKRYEAEQAGLLVELRAIGLQINSVSDLLNTATPYPIAVPILLKHLLLPYSDKTRETIARALSVREARYAWPTFVAEYRKAPIGSSEEGFRLSAKYGLACAVAATVTTERMDDFIALTKDKSLGDSRLLLLSVLRKSKYGAAKQALVELAADPDLAKEIASWKPRKKQKSKGADMID